MTIMQQLLHFKIANLLGQTGKAWVEEMQQRENKMLEQHGQVSSDGTAVVTIAPHHAEEHLIYVDPAKKDTDAFKVHEIQEELHHAYLNPVFAAV